MKAYKVVSHIKTLSFHHQFEETKHIHISTIFNSWNTWVSFKVQQRSERDDKSKMRRSFGRAGKNKSHKIQSWSKQHVCLSGEVWYAHWSKYSCAAVSRSRLVLLQWYGIDKTEKWMDSEFNAGQGKSHEEELNGVNDKQDEVAEYRLSWVVVTCKRVYIYFW